MNRKPFRQVAGASHRSVEVFIVVPTMQIGFTIVLHALATESYTEPRGQDGEVSHKAVAVLNAVPAGHVTATAGFG